MNRSPTEQPQVTPPQKAVLVGDDRDWPADLKDSLGRDGYLVDHVAELSLVPSLLTNGRMRALFVAARPFAASDLLLLRRVRETSPGTAIVVVTRTPTHPDLKRAFESGATAFLSWPASTDSLRQAIESGSLPPPRGVPAPPLKPRTKDAEPAAVPATSSGVAIHNRLPPMYPRRIAFERAIASALAGLKGHWDVALELPGEQSLVVAVVAPDGSSWTMSCCDPQRWDPEAVAETVRGACSQGRWLEPIGAAADASRREAAPGPPRLPDAGGNRT